MFPVNTRLIPNYADVFDGLKNQKHNSINGQMRVRGAARTRREPPDVADRQGHARPDSWGVVFDENSPYKGKVTAYDSPIYIADAALYLMKTQPDLGIKNPYALDDEQFQAAVDLLKTQRGIVGEYWSDYTKERGVQVGRHGARHDLAGDREPAGRGQGEGADAPPEGGFDRVVRYLDDFVEGEAPELHTSG